MEDMGVKRRKLITAGCAMVGTMCAQLSLLAGVAIGGMIEQDYELVEEEEEEVPPIPLTMAQKDDLREKNLPFIFQTNDTNCQNQLRMRKRPFYDLCTEFRQRGLLQDSIHTSIEEQVLSMFLLVVGHNYRFRALQPLYRRSTEVISRYFKQVLFAIGELRDEMIRPPSTEMHPKIGSSDRYYPWFEFLRSGHRHSEAGKERQLKM